MQPDSPEIANQKNKIKIIEKFIVSNDLGLFLQSVVLSPDDNKFIIKMNSGESEDQLQVSGTKRDSQRLSRRERNMTKKYEIIAIDEDNREYIEETIKRNGEELGNSGFLNTNRVLIQDSENPNNTREYFIKPNNIRYLEKEEIYIIRNPPRLDPERHDSVNKSPQLRPSRLISQYDFVIDRKIFEKSEIVNDSGVGQDSKRNHTSIKNDNHQNSQRDNNQDTKINNLLRPTENEDIIKKYIAISYVQPLLSPSNTPKKLDSKNNNESKRNSKNKSEDLTQVDQIPKNSGSFLKDIEISGVDEDQYWKRKKRLKQKKDYEIPMRISEQTKIFKRGDDDTNKNEMLPEEMSQDTRPFNGKLSSPVTSNRSMYHKNCKSKGSPKPKIDEGFYSPRKQLSRPLSYIHPDHARSKKNILGDSRKRSPKSTRTVIRKDKYSKKMNDLSDIPDQESHDLSKNGNDKLASTSPLPIRKSRRSKSRNKSSHKTKKKKPRLEDGEKKYTIRMPYTPNLKQNKKNYGYSRSPSRSRSKPKKNINRAHAHRFKQKFIDKNADFYVKSKAKLENRNLSPHSFWNLEKGPYMSKLLKKKDQSLEQNLESERNSEKKKTVRIKETHRQKSVEPKEGDYEINCGQRDYYMKRYYQQDIDPSDRSEKYKPSQLRGILPGLMSPSNRLKFISIIKLK